MNWRIVRWIDIYVGIPLIYLFSVINKKIFRNTNFFDTRNIFRRVLFVKFWGIGNIIMLLPTAQALKGKPPDLEIDLLTLMSNKDASVSAKIFNQIFTINTKNLITFIMTSLKSFIILRKRNYDLVVDFEQFARFSALCCFIINRGNTIGFHTKQQYRHFLYTRHISYNNDVHITKSFHKLVETIGVANKDTISPIPIVCEQRDICDMESMLHRWGISQKHTVIILHLGTSKNFEQRRWPVKYFAELADRLIDNFGVKIFFTGLSNEDSLARKAMGYLKNKKMAINASSMLNFGQFISLIRLSDLVISADTAPIHLATCLSIPVVGLYGPNTPLVYGPWGKNSIWFYKKLNCSPCITNYNAKIHTCRHPEGKGVCMRKISVDDVFLGIKNNYFDRDGQFRLRKLNRDEKVITVSKKYNN